jgi:anaerobic magnesium-protoporphyrin IX monomethyl ester cyclase
VHVTLLFPPATDPRSPHLSLPSLAATLRGAGVRTTLRDCDLEGMLSLIAPERVAEAVLVCKARLDHATHDHDRSRLRSALLHADAITAAIGDAPARLRDPEAFYNPHLFLNAREAIVRAQEIVSAAAGPVHYSTGPVRYDVDGCSTAKLHDIADVTANPRLNLFDQYYREQVLPELARDPADIVGISILNGQQVLPGLALARLLKEQGHFVVIGGTVFSKFVPQLLERPDFFKLFCHGLVAYEGETALLALLDQLAGARDFASVPNLLHLAVDGRVIEGPVHVEDVNALPTPDFSGLPMEHYLAPRPVLPILTGKGCYFNRCRFCDIPFINKVANKAYRVRTPDRIAADVAALQQRHGVRHFEITDEALAPRLLLHLADALDDHPAVEARFVGYARLEPGFTPEVCARIQQMGVRKLFFGLESGSQATLDHMDKGIHVETARAVLQHCSDAGIAFHLFSIVGFPEETEERARETLQFFLDNHAVLDHPRNSFDIHPFSLDLRTDYYDRAADWGVAIDTSALDGLDFPVNAERWRNTRGLDETARDRLLAEFQRELLAGFPTFRRFPAHLWPGFEEYAVLYADRYAARPFLYRFTLPPSDDPMRLRLEWSESVRIEQANGSCRVECLTGDAVVPRAVVLLLAQPREPATVDHLLGTLAAVLPAPVERRAALVAGLRTAIDALLGCGALRLEPAADSVTLAEVGVA